MSLVNASVLKTSINKFRSPVVAGIHYEAKIGKLIIYYHSDGDKDIDYEIVFEQPRGFKMLDEGDMLNYWGNQEMIGNWLFEIKSGGWLDTEDNAGGFASKLLGFREFLIGGVDDCISVISNKEPIIVKRSV